jgi:rRNA maturation endonuclease Nob1
MSSRHEDVCEFCETEYVVETEDEGDHVQFCPFCGEEILSAKLDDDNEWYDWDEEED